MLLYRGAPAGPGAPGSALARPGSGPQAFGIRLSTVGRGPEGADARARAPGLRGARGEGPAGRGLTRDGTFSRPQMSPRYLQSNSSSHTRPFSAIAELLGEWRGRAWPRSPEAEVPTWYRGRERNVQSRVGRAGAGVGASGPVSASQAAEGVGSVARDEVPQIKLRKQDVTQELVPCGFSLWPVTFQAL